LEEELTEAKRLRKPWITQIIIEWTYIILNWSYENSSRRIR